MMEDNAKGAKELAMKLVETAEEYCGGDGDINSASLLCAAMTVVFADVLVECKPGSEGAFFDIFRSGVMELVVTRKLEAATRAAEVKQR